MDSINFPPAPPTEPVEALREEVRAFLKQYLQSVPAIERARSWMGNDPAFSRQIGARGWIGMVWPERYGGQAASAIERYVVLEEMLAAGAPVGAHWIADRQSGPQIQAAGTPAQRAFFLPKIARGECYFCIGMSEPDSGSDLASVRTRAVAVEGGFLINGTKLWTTNAHISHYMILFCRTGSSDGDRHQGFSQFLIDLKLPGIRISPITSMSGERDFNEVAFEDVFVPEDAVLGRPGNGWHQVTAELALERSGPERFLSSFILLQELVRLLGVNASANTAAAIGRLGAHLVTLRDMSRSVAGMLQQGQDPALQATIVKDLGAVFEQEIPEIARQVMAFEKIEPPPEFVELANYMLLISPAFSLRGGTREILRGIIARGLGLR